MPVIPDTWEAEAVYLLEPGRQRSQRAEIAPLYSSLGERVRLHLKKKKMLFVTVHISFFLFFLKTDSGSIAQVGVQW